MSDRLVILDRIIKCEIDAAEERKAAQSCVLRKTVIYVPRRRTSR